MPQVHRLLRQRGQRGESERGRDADTQGADLSAGRHHELDGSALGGRSWVLVDPSVNDVRPLAARVSVWLSI